MTQLNLSQVRVIDPVLTTVAQGYQNSEFVGSALFPTVPVQLRAGKIITFGKEDFMLYASARAPGENTKRVQFGYSSGNFALVDYSLEGMVPIEVQQEGASGANGWSIDHMTLAVRKTTNILGLRLEKAMADLARAAGNYGASNKITLSGTSQWSDLSNSDPIGAVETAKDAIRAATGKLPNTMVMGYSVLKSLRQHSKVIDRIKYTGRDVPTPELLASLFGVDRVLVGKSIYASDAGAFSDVWGKDVVLAYTETSALAEMGTPSYGYNYNLGGYPIVEQPYIDRNAKAWFVPVSRSEQPVIAAAGAGYLFTNAVA